MIYKFKNLIIKLDNRYQKCNPFKNFTIICHNKAYLEIIKDIADEYTETSSNTVFFKYKDLEAHITNTYGGGTNASKSVIKAYLAGSRNFINMGSCGGINLEVGTSVIGENVINTGHSSFLYLTRNEDLNSSSDITRKIKDFLISKNMIFIAGNIVSLPTLFYTKELLSKYILKDKVIAVEGEMEAVNSTVKWLNHNKNKKDEDIQILNVFYVSDSLDLSKEWINTMKNKEALYNYKKELLVNVINFLNSLQS